MSVRPWNDTFLSICNNYKYVNKEIKKKKTGKRRYTALIGGEESVERVLGATEAEDAFDIGGVFLN